jgi:Phage tail lysozyme
MTTALALEETNLNISLTGFGGSTGSRLAPFEEFLAGLVGVLEDLSSNNQAGNSSAGSPYQLDSASSSGSPFSSSASPFSSSSSPFSSSSPNSSGTSPFARLINALYGNGSSGGGGANLTADYTPGGSSSNASVSSANTSSGGTPSAQEVDSYLKSKYGLSNTAIAGIMGNAFDESSFNPNADNTAENAHGLFQWEGSRLGPMENYVAAHSNQPAWQAEIDYMMSDMKENYPSTYDAVANASSVQDAAMAFAKGYEGCASWTYGNRVTYANEFANEGY